VALAASTNLAATSDLIGMNETTSEICIYCKQIGSSKEHVAPSSLGGNCAIRCVCKKCNVDLSLVDQALAENSPVAISKVTMTPATAFKTQLDATASFRDSRGFDLGVRVGNQMKVEVRPQVFLSGDQMNITAADRAGLTKLIDYIDKQIETGKLAGIHQKITAESTAPRLMMHRSDDAVVEAISPGAAARLLSVVEKNWHTLRERADDPTAAEETRHPQPSVVVKFEMRPNEEFRGFLSVL
jgi:hypothetical protein